jgi:serine protease Do
VSQPRARGSLLGRAARGAQAHPRRPVFGVWLLGLVLALAGCRRDADSGAPPGSSTPLPSGATAVSLPAGSAGPGGSAGPAAPGTLFSPPPGAPPSFAELASRANPAVATVKSLLERENAFGRKVAVGEGMGTAFVYDAKGLMLTNHHVIAEASEILVGFSDGRELRATVVGRDQPTDIAVLKVDADGLPALPLGDSDAVQVGDWVITIGNPYGLAHTVSAGIVSAKGRTRQDVKGLDPSGYFNFLQTDASINPGNSGGPLLNMRGEVIGINSAMHASANGIGFAIPVNMVRQLLPTLLAEGKVRRSAIGVYVEEVPRDASPQGGLPPGKGAVVKRVIGNGPADRAGLAVGDLIVAFDGKPVADPNELRWLASIAGVGKTVTVRIARGDRVFDTRLTLSELPEQEE